MPRLNPDALTEFTLASPNAAPYANNRGRLDADGAATAEIAFPAPLSPALTGLVLNHA